MSSPILPKSLATFSYLHHRTYPRVPAVIKRFFFFTRRDERPMWF